MGPLTRIGNRAIWLVFSLSFFLSAAYSQTGLFCNPTSVATSVRSEGIAEKVGDIVLDCSGGVPGATLTSNLTVFLNVNVTNRLVGSNFTDVLLTVDTGSGPVPASATAQPSAPDSVTTSKIRVTRRQRAASTRFSALNGPATRAEPRLSWLINPTVKINEAWPGDPLSLDPWTNGAGDRRVNEGSAP